MQHQMDKTQQKLTALSARLKQNPLPYRLQKQSQYLAQLQVRLNLGANRQVTERQNKIGNIVWQVRWIKSIKSISTRIFHRRRCQRTCYCECETSQNRRHH